MLDSGEGHGWWVADGRGLSNPSPYILANGSVLLAFRADKGSTISSPKDERVSVAMAPSIYGPFVDSREARRWTRTRERTPSCGRTSAATGTCSCTTCSAVASVHT